MESEKQKYKLDYTKLSSEQRDKLELYQISRKQLNALDDMVDMFAQLFNVIKDNKPDAQIDKLGALLADMRNQLTELNKKDQPELDTTPIVQAVDKLGKLISSIDVKPVVNVPKIDAPQVTVNSDVDISGIEDVMKSIPKAFDKAIKGIVIPKDDNSDIVKAVAALSEKLESIDTGVRMKPQAPTTIGINNDVTTIDKTYATRIDDQTPILYVGKAPVGSATSAAVWQIHKIDETSGVIITWADGNANFDNVWDNHSSLTYS